jgi:hypothetical protein
LRCLNYKIGNVTAVTSSAVGILLSSDNLEFCSEPLSQKLYKETPHVCRKHNSKKYFYLEANSMRFIACNREAMYEVRDKKTKTTEILFTLGKVAWKYFVILDCAVVCKLRLFCSQFLDHGLHVSAVVLKVRWSVSLRQQSKPTQKHVHNDTQVSRCYVSSEHWIKCVFLSL